MLIVIQTRRNVYGKYFFSVLTVANLLGEEVATVIQFHVWGWSLRLFAYSVVLILSAH